MMVLQIKLGDKLFHYFLIPLSVRVLVHLPYLRYVDVHAWNVSKVTRGG